MSTGTNDIKPAQTGLVDMGNISFYDNPSQPFANFHISDLSHYAGSFSEIVLNVTWAQLQPAESGPLDTSVINGAIDAVQAYNAENGTDVGIKLRVWGGYTAPVWAKNIDGPALTVTGPGTVDPGNDQPETIGRFWTADYIDAWTSFQTELAATYDSNTIIRGISNTAGASATDEPFSQVSLSQMPELQAGGYTDAAEELTLRAAVADYSGWATTPLDYTMSLFRLENSDSATPDGNFTLAVLQEAQNSSRMVQASNHALNSPLPSWATFLYAQLETNAALNPATVPASYQTDSPAMLGSSANWSDVVSQGVAADAGNIELWPIPSSSGFTNESPGTIAALATTLANGVAPVTGAPDDGKPLGFIAPTVVTGAPGAVPFSGTNAVLLASATTATSYTVTVTSAGGNTLTATDDRVLLSNSSLTFSGSLAQVNTILASLTDREAAGTDALLVSASDNEGNTAAQRVGVVASADAGAGPVIPGQAPIGASGPMVSYAWTGHGTNGLFSNAANWSPAGGPPGAADTAVFNPSPDPMTVAGTGVAGTLIVDGAVLLGGGSDITVGQGGAGDVDIADRLATPGALVVAGVDTSLSIAGNLNVGGTDSSAGGVATLLAALSPSAYSTASLSIGGRLQVWGQGSVRMTGALGAAAIDIASGGMISGDGTLAATGGDAIENDGTIEAATDQTLGLEQMTVATPVAGTGQIVIDAGADLTLDQALGPDQTVAFGAPTMAQLSDAPSSPTTLALQEPYGFAGAITGFSFADSLVLDGVDASSASYAAGTLTVDPTNSGTPLTFILSGDLTDLQPLATVTDSGSAATTAISFVAAGDGQLPGVAAPATLQAAPGVAVPVPDIVLDTPFLASPVNDAAIGVTITAGTGTLAAGNDNGNTTLSQPSPQQLVLDGTVAAIERSLQTLTYRGAAAGSDRITISVSDYDGTSAPTEIAVADGSAGSVYDWSSSTGGSFANAGRWTTNGSQAASAPGGADIASFGAGTYTVTGDGAVAEASVAGALTLTGDVSAQGLPSGDAALSVDAGGALTLAGGGVLTAGGTAAVGVTGSGLLTLTGGALTLTGPAGANALVIGQDAGSAGTVLDLEQIEAAGTAVVGGAGSGTLQLLGVAASASDGAADVGQAAGGIGSAVVDGGEWSNSGSLIVGDAGAGSLLIDGAANGVTGQVTAFNATIGAEPGSAGTVTVPGGDLLVANATASSSTLAVGVGGTGTLAASDDGNVSVGVALAQLPNSGMVENTGTLIVGAGSGGSGSVTLGTGASLEVDGNAAVGQFGGAGTVTVGQSASDTGLLAMAGTLTIGATGLVRLGSAGAVVRASAVVVDPGGVLEGAGTVSGDGGGNSTVLPASIVNDGTIAASDGGLLIYGSVVGTGTLMATAGTALTLQAAVGSGQTLLFGQDALTTLNDPGAFHGTFDGFAAGDTLDLGSVPESASGTATLGAGNLLTISEPGQTYHLQLDPTRNFSGETFHLAPDGTWGTSLTAEGKSAPTTSGESAPVTTEPSGPAASPPATEPNAPAASAAATAEPSGPPFTYLDVTTGTLATVAGQVYDGPEAGLQAQYIDTSPDQAVIAADEPNAYIVAGTGMDALVAQSGNNVLSSQGNAAWFVGGSGDDDFFVQTNRLESSWQTIENFHAGDNVTLWGFIPGASSYSWSGKNGATGGQGLTLESVSPTGVPGYVTFAGVTTADLPRIGVVGGSIGGQPYLLVHQF